MKSKLEKLEGPPAPKPEGGKGRGRGRGRGRPAASKSKSAPASKKQKKEEEKKEEEKKEETHKGVDPLVSSEAPGPEPIDLIEKFEAVTSPGEDEVEVVEKPNVSEAKTKPKRKVNKTKPIFNTPSRRTDALLTPKKKPSPKKKVKQQKKTQAEEPTGRSKDVGVGAKGPKNTFAGRYPPSSDVCRQRFDALKNEYVQNIEPRVFNGSKVEAPSGLDQIFTLESIFLLLERPLQQNRMK